MRSDEPTLPSLEWYDAGGGAAHGEPGESETPTWPTVDKRTPRGMGGADQWPKGYGSALALGISLGANVMLLLGMLALLLLGHLTIGAAGGPAGSPAAGKALDSTTVMTSPTPLSGWLQVAPSSVQLGCAASQRTQFVVVQNTGPLGAALRKTNFVGAWVIIGTLEDGTFRLEITRKPPTV